MKISVKPDFPTDEKPLCTLEEDKVISEKVL